jgi:CO/xanthine dehydrogenase FAD-binding subunit
VPVFETYEAPKNLKAALELLRVHRGRVRPVAGGTDVLVRLKRGTLSDAETVLLNVKNIPEFRTIETVRASGSAAAAVIDTLRIGAAVTIRELEFSDTVRSHAPILSETANRIASAQIRAMATIGGNIANASPAADMAIPLLLLDAEVETARLEGGPGGGNGISMERIPVEGFFTGPGETALDDQSLVAGFFIRRPAGDARFVFRKGGVRPAMECAVVSTGCGVRCDSKGVVRDARVAFGAVAPTPIRARNIEAFLTGKKLSSENNARAVGLVGDAIQPISDVRGSAEYRRELAGALLKIALHELLGTDAPAGTGGGML